MRLISCNFSPGILYRFGTKAPRQGWIALPVARGTHHLGIVRTNPYWFAPVFQGKKPEFLQTSETALICVKGASAKSQVVLPLPGPGHRAWLETRRHKIGVAWSADRHCQLAGQPIAFLGDSNDPSALVAGAITALQPLLKLFRTRADKSSAPFVDWFGWCTWDAFYQEVTASKVKAGLKSFQQGGLLPRFLIIDDGWQDASGWHLRSLGTNGKFRGGLAPLAQAVRKAGVRHVGVWHTLHGYWHGVAPTGKIARAYRVCRIPQKTKVFTGWPAAFNPAVRHVVHPDDIHRFYDDYYARLAEAGIDFTKVDGQASFLFCQPPGVEPNAAIGHYQRAFQGASAHHLPAGSICCMANVSDLLWRLQTVSVWRNSDDFYPQKPFQAHAIHLVSNAYNALLSGPFAVLDWDMFHSRHRFALFHALARALSGGPVYVSDSPGHHDFDLLRRLVLPDGRIPRFPGPGLPPPRWLQADPLRSGRALVVANSGGPMAAIGLFNCLCEPAPARITDSWCPGDLPTLSGDSYIAHELLTGTVRLVTRGQKIRVTLEAEGACSVWTVSPLHDGLFAPLGLDSYFSAAATVESVQVVKPTEYCTKVRHGGTHLAWCARAPVSVTVGGTAVSYAYNKTSRLLRVTAANPAPAEIVYRFPPG